MSQGQIIPFGYAVPNSVAILERLMADRNTYLVDVRYSVKSLYKPEWSGRSLKERYGERYLWIQALGNVNYFNDGPIQLANPEVGLSRLLNGLRKGYTLVLLCTCVDYNSCHRRVIVEMLREVMPEIEVVQPVQSGQAADILKCISIQQPYAWLITHPQVLLQCGLPVKDIENRGWSTSYRGDLLIHTGRDVDADLFHRGHLLQQPWERKFGDLGTALWMAMPQISDQYERGAIVGQAKLMGVVRASGNPWFRGRYGLVLQDACAFETPIPYAGALKIFDVPVRFQSLTGCRDSCHSLSLMRGQSKNLLS